MDNRKVLLVDDEANILSGLKRQLRKQFDITTAISGHEALVAARNEGPFAVIVSDMRMPGMSGLEVLAQMQKISPDTTRIMLTGNSDQQTAIDAVNQGNVFRFLTKPCETDILTNVIGTAIDQYELVIAERELLEQTLAGSIKVLVDVLSLTNPAAFGNTVKVRNWSSMFADYLKIEQPWKLDVAAALSTIGLVAVPNDVLLKIQSGQDLNEAEANILFQVPELSQKLIENIPRLMPVAEIIYFQDKGYDGSGLPTGDVSGDDIPLGARVLKILKDLAVYADGPVPSAAAFAELEKRKHLYDEEILGAVRKCFEEHLLASESRDSQHLELSPSMLRAGDVLETNLENESGNVFLEAGEVINDIIACQIPVLLKMHTFKEPVKVYRKS